MKKTTFNIAFLLLFMMIIISACKKDDGLIRNEPSHRVIFTSEMDFENTIEVNGTISFGDVSPGVESRTWTFPGNGVVDIVDSDNDETSSEATVKTFFNEVGVYEVHLNQVFKEEAFVENQLRGKILDTTIVVTVLSPIDVQLKANYINRDGSIGDELNMTDGALNEIPAAREVLFTWNGAGSPRTIDWDFERAGPSTFSGQDSSVIVNYKFLGTFDLEVIGSRARPFGRDTLNIENFIKVVPSTDPVVVEEVTEIEGKIAVIFSRELQLETLESSDFDIAVLHEGELITNTISNISLDPIDGNIVLIDIGSERLYNDDSISVSFLDGNLISTDGVLASPFSEAVLAFRQENILETNSNFDFSFENTTGDNWVFAEEWSEEWGMFESSVTSDRAIDGNQSGYFIVEAGANMVVEQRDLNGDFVEFPANASKTYEVGCYIYLEQKGSTPATALQPDLRFYWKPEFPNPMPSPEFNGDYPVGEWTFESSFVKFDATGDFHFEIRVFNQSNPEQLKLYLDKIVLYEVELRP